MHYFKIVTCNWKFSLICLEIFCRMKKILITRIFSHLSICRKKEDILVIFHIPPRCIKSLMISLSEGSLDRPTSHENPQRSDKNMWKKADRKFSNWFMINSDFQTSGFVTFSLLLTIVGLEILRWCCPWEEKHVRGINMKINWKGGKNTKWKDPRVDVLW